MSFYRRFVLPRVIHLACGAKPHRRMRERILPQAHGEVLEVGVGSGLNLSHYDAARIRRLHGLEPSPGLLSMARRAAREVAFEVNFVEASASDIPLEDDSVDTVVLTWTLCSIDEPAPALAEMSRVLRPGGQMLFCEHGRAPDAGVRRWQRRLHPIWTRLGGGCHLDRPIPDLLAAGGFEIRRLESRYLPGWRPASYNYWGVATRL